MDHIIDKAKEMDAARALYDAGHRVHHTGSKRGYVSRRGGGVIAPYTGRFGTGYTWTRPRWDTTRFVWVEYWIHDTGLTR